MGSTGLAGSTSLGTDSRATIQGAGNGYFSHSSDSFHYAAQPLPSNADFTMKVTSVPAPTGSHTPQTGIMARENMDANARYVAVFLANGKCILQSRTATGAIPMRIATISGVAFPAWLRLIREEDAFSAYISSDGINWRLVGDTKNYIASGIMGKSAYIGAAVSSGDPGHLQHGGHHQLQSAGRSDHAGRYRYLRRNLPGKLARKHEQRRLLWPGLHHRWQYEQGQPVRDLHPDHSFERQV